MNKLKLTEKSKNKIQQNQEFVNKWIKGLRSGAYAQIQSMMCRENTPNSACCLHVMEMECNGRDWEEGIGKIYPSRMYGGVTWPEELKAEDVSGNLLYPVNWNDSLSLTFNQIADLLETGEILWN